MEVQRRAPSGPRRRGAARDGARGRTDRDGDMKMGLTSRHTNRVGKPSAANAASSAGRKELINRGSKSTVISQSAKKAIARQIASKDASMKDTRKTPRGLVELKVTGWEKSKAFDTAADGGISTLIKWLEKKASQRLGSKIRDAKIKKSRQEGNELIISVPSEDVGAFTRINNFVWAQATIHIKALGEPDQGNTQLSSAAEKTKDMLRGVLERRYNADLRLLDLSALGQDEELKAQAIFNANSTASKFFPAMMRILELAFDTAAERNAAVVSVSLANNDLPDLKTVTTLSETLPKLQNLDLSNNNFESLSALGSWRRRFRDLQHLILSNNPLEGKEPTYAADLTKWYPNLRFLNNVQVRSEEDIAQRLKTTSLPFPIRSAAFRDEGGIAETFVRSFFKGIDEDRAALIAHYYDENSEFSFALNTAAMRDPSAEEKVEKQEWDHYIKGSRNLKKITHLGARHSRLFRGTQAIAKILLALPRSKHPDLASEAQKWLIEAHLQPNIPDPSGQSPGGVDGFCITVHTEFDEVDVTNGQAGKKRSVDHVFMIGPNGNGGVRVHSHIFTIRAYGGFSAYQAEENGPLTPPQEAVGPDTVPQLPPGLTIPLAEQMVTELTKQTNLTLEYSKECLEQTGWNFEAALVAFANAKANLPPHAFVSS